MAARDGYAASADAQHMYASRSDGGLFVVSAPARRGWPRPARWHSQIHNIGDRPDARPVDLGAGPGHSKPSDSAGSFQDAPLACSQASVR